MALSLLDKVDQLIEDTILDEEKQRAEKLSQAFQSITTLRKVLTSPHNIRILSKYNFTRDSSVFTTLKHSDLLIYGYCHQYGTKSLMNDIIDFILKLYQILKIEMVLIGSELDIKPNVNGKVELISNNRYGFASIRGDVPLILNHTTNNISISKYYYEFSVGELSLSLAQIGFCDDYCTPDGYRMGIGDDEHSWAFDGGRVKKWMNIKGEDYGQKWRIGDIVGCCIDIHNDNEKITFDLGFYLNGTYLGKAYTGQKYSGNIYPAASFSCSTKYKAYGTIVFAVDQFKYMPKGYTSII